MPPMRASGWPSTLGPPVQLEGLVDRVGAGGGGHVHQLLDVPPGRLGPVGGHVEAPGHAGDVAHAQLLAPRQVRVPVGPGRVPQVDVGVDDAGRPGGHRGRPRPSSPPSGDPSDPTMRPSTSSNQSGTAGPPKVTLARTRGWLRSPRRPAPTDQLGARTGGRSRGCTAGGPPARRPSGDRPVTGLDPDGEGGHPVVGGPAGRPGQLGGGLGPAPPPGRGRVGEGDQADRVVRRAAERSATARAQPASSVDLRRRCRRARRGSASQPGLGVGRRAGRRRGRPRRASTGVGRRRPRPGRGRRPRSRAARRAADRRARHAPGLEGGGDGVGHLGPVGHDHAGAAPAEPAAPSAADSSARPANRGLLPPPLRWSRLGGDQGLRGRRPPARGRERGQRPRCRPPRAAGAGRSPPPPTRRRTAPGPGRRRTPRPRGGRPAGPSSSGRGMAPSDSPPVDGRGGADGSGADGRRRRARPRAAVTMRVMAMGDMALTDDAGRRLATQLPGERGDGPLGAAVGAGVGRPATPTRR